MIIIVEGSNKTGKTTYIEKMVEQGEKDDKQVKIINFRIHQELEKVEPNIINQKNISLIAGFTQINMIENLFDNNTNIYFDRFHLSELVYGKAVRRYYNEGMYDLENRLLNSKHAIKLILLTSKFDHIECKFEKAKLLKYQNDFISQYAKSKIVNKSIISFDILLEKSKIK